MSALESRSQLDEDNGCHARLGHLDHLAKGISVVSMTGAAANGLARTSGVQSGPCFGHPRESCISKQLKFWVSQASNPGNLTEIRCAEPRKQ